MFFKKRHQEFLRMSVYIQAGIKAAVAKLFIFHQSLHSYSVLSKPIYKAQNHN
jgi:hypothetical protein